MKTLKYHILTALTLLFACATGRAQAPVDYEDFLDLSKISTHVSPTIVPASETSWLYPTTLGSLTGCYIDDWIALCGDDEDTPEVSAGSCPIEDVEIEGTGLRVYFGATGGSGKLIVSIKIPERNDSLRIAVVYFQKAFPTVTTEPDPSYNLGSKNFSIYSFVDSTGQTSVQSKSFIDGFGRVLQTSLVDGSPTGGDIINIVEYDSRGRESKTYMPFVADTSGSLLYSPVFQQSYYAAKYNDQTNSPYAYTKTEYDGSPLSAVTRTSEAGADISSDGPNGGSPILTEYRQNGSADSVWRFELDSLDPGKVYKRGYYANGQLQVTTSYMLYQDEVFDHAEKYTDAAGQDILVEKANSDGRVYYVYDNFGQLCFTIPQVCADSMSYDVAYNVDNPLIARYCYHNVYDSEGNLIREYNPGAEPKIYIYDKLNRLILVQDGNRRQNDEWVFSKYDVYNRPVLVGILFGGSEEEHRTQLAQSTLLHESRSNSSAALHLYTNQCYPVLTDSNSEIYGINYYDDYDWSDISWTDNVTSANYDVKGMATRTKTRVLGEDKWLNKVIYYDAKYQVVKTYADLYPDGTETYSARYDFRGNTLYEKVEQQIGQNTEGYERFFSYDLQGRLLKVQQQVMGDTVNNLVDIVTNTYDDLGERSSWRLHDSLQGPQTIYRRNLTGTRHDYNGAFTSRLRYGSEGNQFDDPQPYTRLTRHSWISELGNNGYAYRYDENGQLVEGAYLNVIGSSDTQDEYYTLTQNSVQMEYDDRTGNILSITRSGKKMPMTYEGYRMLTAQPYGEEESEEFLYDDNGNLIYDGLARQHYVFNTVDRLQEVWDTGTPDPVAVDTTVWLTYNRTENPTLWASLHSQFPDYFTEEGYIREEYRVQKPDGTFYLIPTQYPSLADSAAVAALNAGLGHTSTFLGGSPQTLLTVNCPITEEIDTNYWILFYQASYDDPDVLHNTFPDYFDEIGHIYERYRIIGRCYMIPQKYAILTSEGYIESISNRGYRLFSYDNTPPTPGYVPKQWETFDNEVEIEVLTDKFVRFEIDEDIASDPAYFEETYGLFPKYFETYTNIIREEYRIRDNYYYLPVEYPELLNPSNLAFFYTVEWEIVDEFPGVATTPPDTIFIATGESKRMEAVYDGQGNKLAVRFFEDGSATSGIYYSGNMVYASNGNDSIRSLRDMSMPEGVVKKSSQGYSYYYFYCDYLGNVRTVTRMFKARGSRYVSTSTEQMTNFDPLGLALNLQNLDKNPYLYNGKEFYDGFSDAYAGVYDFGARYYNPLFGRWFAHDPEKECINPYLYCGNNPIMLIDPNGLAAILRGDPSAMAMYVKQLSIGTEGINLYIKEDGILSYAIQEGVQLNEQAAMIQQIIDNPKVTVDITLRRIYHDEGTGGIFGGSTYDALSGKATAYQIVDPYFLQDFDAALNERGKEGGIGAFHELTEAYEGAKMAIDQGRNVGNSQTDNASFLEAHSRASEVPEVSWSFLDKKGRYISETASPEKLQTIKYVQYWYKDSNSNEEYEITTYGIKDIWPTFPWEPK